MNTISAAEIVAKALLLLAKAVVLHAFIVGQYPGDYWRDGANDLLRRRSIKD